MTGDEFFESVTARKFESVYLFQGSEEYIKESALSALRAALLPEGLEVMNESLLDAPRANDIYEAFETLPFLADRRLVIVKNFSLLQKSAKAEGEPSEDAEALIERLRRAPDTASVVFYVRGEAGRNTKFLKYLDSIAGNVNFKPLDPRRMLAWVNRELKKYGKKMDQNAVERLAFLTGGELVNITGEIEKLAAYAGEMETITVSDVEAVVPPNADATVFKMLDCLTSLDMAGAQRLLKTLLDIGEARAGILSMVIRQVRLMTDARLIGGAPAEIARATGQSEYSIKNAARAARKIAPEALIQALDECVESDYLFKSGALRDQAALDRAISILYGLFQNHAGRL